MAELTLDALAKRYGEAVIVKGASLTVAQGEFLSLLGPSGCGKTTILRMIAGLVEPSAGRILIGGRDVTALPPNHRGIGLVFQSYALFPHMTVYENVAFGLRRQKMKGVELDARVRDALACVRLPQLAERMPRQLSGGQQQRVAIARALAPRPSLMLFDEPLSNLDAQLRDEMQIELKRIQRDTGITTVFVTHDQAEALTLSDRICVLAHGEIQQIGPPEDVYRRPVNGFVAGFIGKPNRLAGTVGERDGVGGTVRIADGPPIPAARIEALPGTTVDVIVRQEAIRIVAPGTPAAVTATVMLRAFMGARVQYVARLRGSTAELVFETPSVGSPDMAVGAEVALGIDPADVFVTPATDRAVAS